MKKWIYSGTREEQPSERELMHGKLARKAASEGIVLLKNEGILPLKKDTAAALLGYGAEKTVKGGIGSGDVNNRKNISIYQGLKEAGVKIVSEDWISDYHNRYEQAREAWKEKVLEEAKKVDNPFDAYAENPFAMPLGRKVAEEDICEAVGLEPNYFQYQSLKQRLEGGTGWYQKQSTVYGRPDFSGQDWCMKMCLLNLLCNCCCNRGMCCGTPIGYR